MYPVTMERRRHVQYDGLTVGRVGLSEHDLEDLRDDGHQGVTVAFVDHPRRWARRFRRLHTLVAALPPLRGEY